MKSKIDKKVFSWAMYDWANSAFSTTVMAGFFPVFFKEYWSLGTDPTLTTARLGTAISLGSFLMALLSPTMGALADRKGYKKLFAFLFMLCGVASTAWLAFIGSGMWFMALLAYSAGMMSFNASTVFYDGLLPSIAPGKKADMASSLGYSLGYLGGGVCFLVNVLMYLKPELFGIADGVTAVKYSFITVAIWWLVFSIPMFRNVPEPHVVDTGVSLWTATRSSVRQLLNTFRHLSKDRSVLFFLIAFWLYIDGVYTVMTMAVDFGITLGFKSSDLIAALLIVQFIGFPFALMYGKLAEKFGCRIPILTCLVVYGGVVIGSTLMTQAWHFYVLASVIGMVQGGVQALSRSLYSRMIPPQASGEYFGLFNLVGKFASIFGPLLVGWGGYLLGDAKYGMLGLLLLFGIGGAFLMQVKEPEINPDIA